MKKQQIQVMSPLSMRSAERPILCNNDFIRSKHFDDVYFNTDNVLAATSHDYLEGNDLSQRWDQVEPDHTQKDQTFVVAETGFGTGLNLLLLMRMWQAHPKKPQQIHYVSCELYPFDKVQLSAVLDQFPELKTQSHELLKHYPGQRMGFHRFELLPGFSVTLMLGDAATCYAQCQMKVDAWFLDGFDPKKNPDMWSEPLFKQVSRLSKTGTTLSTYTAASHVRRQILAVGFEVNKRKGFGKKREIITAVMPDVHKPQTAKQNWSPIKAGTNTKDTTNTKDIGVLGAGIAGLSVSRACALAGHAVTLVDKAEPMQGASGNPLAMVMPYLTAQSSPEALFYWRAFDFALQAYQADSDSFQRLGIHEWCVSSKKQQWKDTLFEAHHWPDELIQQTENGVLYPSSGVVDTQKLKDHWLTYAQDVVQASVTEIKRQGQRWVLMDKDKKVIKSCDVLVITSGIHSLQFEPFEHLPLVPKHGQVSVVECEQSLPFDQVQRHEGYAIPMADNHCLLGATFDHVNEAEWFNTPVLDQVHLERNLKKWQGFEHFDLPPHQMVSGRAGIRTTTPDHLPVCGTAVDPSAFKTAYQDLHHGRHWQQYPEAKTHENLYLMTGLGARGFTSAPLLGQLLADMILDRPLPIEKALCDQLHPNRFLYRALKKTPK